MTGCNTVNVGGKQRPLVMRGPITGHVALGVDKRTDEQEGVNTERKSTTTATEQTLRLRTTGDVYHANLLSYTAAVGLGLTQQKLDSDLESGMTSDSLNEYDFTTRLLQAKPYPMSFYSRKTDRLTPRQYVGSVRTESEQSGATLALRSKSWPMRFQYSTGESSHRSLASTSNDAYSRENERFLYSLDHDFSPLSTFSFDFERDDVSYTSSGITTNAKTDSYSLTHGLTFGEEEQHGFRSFLSLLNQSVPLDYQYLHWAEDLRLQHSETFLTNYEFSLSKRREGQFNSASTIQNRTIQGRAGFEHKLYDSLVTRGSVHASDSDFNGTVQSKTQGANLAFAYNKKNRWGVLSSSYSISPTHTEQLGGGEMGTVLDEQHIATELTLVELEKQSIDITSIIVKDVNGLPFLEGEDYTITQVGGTTLLSIIIIHGLPLPSPPNFAEGQVFLVDYSFAVEPKREEDTLRQNFIIRQRFKNGFSVFYKRRQQDETIESTRTNITPDEYVTDTFGTSYTKNGLQVSGQFSKTRRSQLPSTQKQIDVKYQKRIGEDTTAHMRALKYWVEYGEPDNRKIELFTAEGGMSSRLNDKYNITASVDYRDQTNSKSGKTKGFQYRSQLQYKYRQLVVTTGVDFSFLKRDKSKSNSVFWYLRLKRIF